ncbi:YbaN family protein [Rubrivivax sp. RP6-9]|uniref:YbaN family protein n=1 Tax=Rubrivivax sp. RP6-9 TaxID=3415750 RepID=UPI003CC6020E
MPTAALKRLLWRALAALCVLLGLVGVVVPGLPTVPFLLLAAWAASRGWPALEQWLLNHPRHGPGIRRWRAHGAIPRRAKWAATVMMTASSTVLLLAPVPLWLRIAAPLLMACVALWMWRQPD